MWTNEIINIVVENKNIGEFSEKSGWVNHSLNLFVQFSALYRWGALELTAGQYEGIEEESVDRHTYDTQYNSESRFNINNFEKKLFFDGLIALEVECCEQYNAEREAHDLSVGMASGLLNIDWFKNKYGVETNELETLFMALTENGWLFRGHSYSISGDISVVRKSEYDYLWMSDCVRSEDLIHNGTYRARIEYLNKVVKT